MSSGTQFILDPKPVIIKQTYQNKTKTNKQKKKTLMWNLAINRIQHEKKKNDIHAVFI